MNKHSKLDDQKTDSSNYEKQILCSSGETLRSDFVLSLFALIEKARKFKYINNEAPFIISMGKNVHPYELLNDIFIKGMEEKVVLNDCLISTYIHPAGNQSLLMQENQRNCSASPTMRNVISSSSNGTDFVQGKNVSTIEEFPRQKTNISLSIEDVENYKNELYFSWIDLSQQLYADACLLKLLTLHNGIQKHGFNINSSFVQDVVERMIMGLYSLVRFREDIADEIDNINTSKMILLNERYVATRQGVEFDTNYEWPEFPFDRYLNYHIDNRLVMVQWPLYICGLCCIESRHKAVIECCFSALIGLGVGSGELSLKKLRTIWYLQKCGKFDYETFNLYAQGFSDDDDYVPFM